jgi:hypothetical protein
MVNKTPFTLRWISFGACCLVLLKVLFSFKTIAETLLWTPVFSLDLTTFLLNKPFFFSLAR